MKNSTKGSCTLKKIVARAKKLKKAHPGKKWTTYIKEAARKL